MNAKQLGMRIASLKRELDNTSNYIQYNGNYDSDKMVKPLFNMEDCLQKYLDISDEITKCTVLFESALLENTVEVILGDDESKKITVKEVFLINENNRNIRKILERLRMITDQTLNFSMENIEASLQEVNKRISYLDNIYEMALFQIEVKF